MSLGGAKALLTISPCVVNNGKISVDGSLKKFAAMINPAGYEQTFKLSYSKNKVLVGWQPVLNSFSSTRTNR